MARREFQEFGLKSFMNALQKSQGMISKPRCVSSVPQNLTQAEFCVLSYIYSEAAGNDGICSKTHIEIGEGSKCSKSTVKRAISVLREKKYIFTRTFTPPGKTSYTLYWINGVASVRPFLTDEERRIYKDRLKEEKPDLFTKEILKKFEEQVKDFLGKFNLSSYKDLIKSDGEFLKVFTHLKKNLNEVGSPMDSVQPWTQSTEYPSPTVDSVCDNSGVTIEPRVTNEPIAAHTRPPMGSPVDCYGVTDERLGGHQWSPKEASNKEASKEEPINEKQVTEANNTYISTKNGLDNTNIDSEREITINDTYMRNEKRNKSQEYDEMFEDEEVVIEEEVDEYAEIGLKEIAFIGFKLILRPDADLISESSRHILNLPGYDLYKELFGDCNPVFKYTRGDLRAKDIFNLAYGESKNFLRALCVMAHSDKMLKGNILLAPWDRDDWWAKKITRCVLENGHKAKIEENEELDF